MTVPLTDETIDELARRYVHLDSSEFEGILEGTLEPEQRAKIERHIAMCAMCAEEVRVFGEEFSLDKDRSLSGAAETTP
jgi:hypothetical protein